MQTPNYFLYLNITQTVEIYANTKKIFSIFNSCIPIPDAPIPHSRFHIGAAPKPQPHRKRQAAGQMDYPAQRKKEQGR